MVLRVTPCLALFVACTAFAMPQNSAGAVTVVHMTTTKQYNPKTVTISVGDTVEWVNDDPGNIHNATTDKDATDVPKAIQMPKGAKPFNSGLMLTGKRYRYKFTVPGTYRYICVPHQPGMVGTVIVKPKDNAGGDQ
jgi:plastocyanin